MSPSRITSRPPAPSAVPGRVRLFKYMLRPAFVPPLTILGLEFASLLGNAFVVELVFSWPGMASYGVRSILQKDLNAVMGVVMISGLFFVLANLAIDVLVGFVDPRDPHPRRTCVSAAAVGEAPRISIAYQNWRRFSRNPTAVAGSAIVVIVVAAALFAPWIAPYPQHVGAMVNFRARHLPPVRRNTGLAPTTSAATSSPGCCSATVYRCCWRRSSLASLFRSASTLGLVAGYFGGWTEIIIMRLTDIALAIPPLVMALAVTAVLTPSLFHAMLAIAALWWTWHTRLIFSITRTLRQQEFVEAARTLGASSLHILFRELLPNCASAILVKTSLDFGFVILIGAALSYLGLGVQPPTADLGTMVANGADFLPDRWWESLLPGAAILFVALGFNLLGDGLRDLYDVESVR